MVIHCTRQTILPKRRDETDEGFEQSWDIWQQWMNPLTSRIPYMVLPGMMFVCRIKVQINLLIQVLYLCTGNHDETSSEGDSSKHVFGNDTYYGIPASQRNFTAYSHRFR